MIGAELYNPEEKQVRGILYFQGISTDELEGKLKCVNVTQKEFKQVAEDLRTMPQQAPVGDFRKYSSNELLQHYAGLDLSRVSWNMFESLRYKHTDFELPAIYLDGFVRANQLDVIIALWCRAGRGGGDFFDVSSGSQMHRVHGGSKIGHYTAVGVKKPEDLARLTEATFYIGSDINATHSSYRTHPGGMVMEFVSPHPQREVVDIIVEESLEYGLEIVFDSEGVLR